MLIKIGDCWVDPKEIIYMTEYQDPFTIHDSSIAQDGSCPHGPKLLITLRGAGSHTIESTMDQAEAALIDAGVIEAPVYDEVLELTEEEDAKAQALFDAGYKYLARDEDGKLFAYKFEPVENQGFYMPGSPAETAERIERFFDFIAPGGCCPIAGLLLPY